MNRVKKKPATEPIEDNGRPSPEVAAEAWANYRKRNDSVVVDQFFGQDQSQLWCPDCMKDGKSRRKFDPRLAVLVSLPTVTTKLQEVTLVRLRRRPTDQDGAPVARVMKYGVQIPKSGCMGKDMAKASDTL